MHAQNKNSLKHNQWLIPGCGPGARPSPPPPPLIFWPNWGPKGRKKFYDRPLPLISGSGWPPPRILIWRYGSATDNLQQLKLSVVWLWGTDILQRQVIRVLPFFSFLLMLAKDDCLFLSFSEFSCERFNWSCSLQYYCWSYGTQWLKPNVAWRRPKIARQTGVLQT